MAVNGWKRSLMQIRDLRAEQARVDVVAAEAAMRTAESRLADAQAERDHIAATQRETMRITLGSASTGAALARRAALARSLERAQADAESRLDGLQRGLALAFHERAEAGRRHALLDAASTRWRATLRAEAARRSVLREARVDEESVDMAAAIHGASGADR